MTMTLSVLFFASILGTWVDREPSRLATLISTIMANRISIISACICWIFIVGDKNTGLRPRGSTAKVNDQNDPEIQSNDFFYEIKVILFVFVLIFSVVERLSRVMNLLSIERDWLPTLSPPHHEDEGEPSKFGLTELNAVVSRIDLICKLLSPIALSAFVSAVGSMRIGILAVLALNAATWMAEIWSARLVWKMNGRIRELKQSNHEDVNPINDSTEADNPRTRGFKRSLHQLLYGICWIPYTLVSAVQTWLLDYRQNISIYFSYAVWVPSMALSILHFSVLNYSATLTVYLLNSGFSLNFITTAKALCAISEIACTFFMPWGVRKFGAAWVATHPGPSLDSDDVNTRLLANAEQEHPIDDGEDNADKDKDDAVFVPETDMGVALIGFLGLAQMEICLLPALVALWSLSSTTDSAQVTRPSTLIMVTLLLTIPVSRFGRWANNLATRQLTQTLVPALQRSSFAGAETGFVSLFGLGHWVVTAAWNQRLQFHWLALSSVVSVGLSAAAYAVWLRREVREGSRRERRGAGRGR
jgi:solute carrier family 40 (iron-regulated transporter), member 1